ncbi:hypothetical protein U0Y97_10315 [Enterobacter chuandaensis]|uniref:hypothetical protein n=1 Tax=Enterobacter chuandaensis TaxID=2497875 RepID=UPI0039C03817
MNRHSRIIATAAVTALVFAGTAAWTEKQADDKALTVVNTPDSSRWVSDINAADHNFASKQGGRWTMTIANPLNTEYTADSYPVLHPGKDQPISVCMHFDEGDLLANDSPDDNLTKKDLSQYDIAGFSDEAACEKVRKMLDHLELVREQSRENAELMTTKWAGISRKLYLVALLTGGFAGVWLCMHLLFIGWIAFIRATAKAIRGD